jgi:hypothetical protein
LAAAVEVTAPAIFVTETTGPWPWSVTALEAAFGVGPEEGASEPFSIEVEAAFGGSLGGRRLYLFAFVGRGSLGGF